MIATVQNSGQIGWSPARGAPVRPLCNTPSKASGVNTPVENSRTVPLPVGSYLQTAFCDGSPGQQTHHDVTRSTGTSLSLYQPSYKIVRSAVKCEPLFSNAYSNSSNSVTTVNATSATSPLADGRNRTTVLSLSLSGTLPLSKHVDEVHGDQADGGSGGGAEVVVSLHRPACRRLQRVSPVSTSHNRTSNVGSWSMSMPTLCEVSTNDKLLPSFRLTDKINSK
jgi:hypothetical protein